jgi:uncharacterized protein (TIGR03437 family)
MPVPAFFSCIFWNRRARCVIAWVFLSAAAVPAAWAGVEYATFFGGSQRVLGLRAGIDSQGFIYLAGTSGGVDFPVTAGVPAGVNGGVFVAKIDPRMPRAAGLVYSRFFEFEELAAMTVTPGGLVYLAGTVRSRTMPTTPNAYQPQAPTETVFPERDAFLMVIDPGRGAGSELVYATYLGGTLQDTVRGLRVDGQGRAVMWGRTRSTDFPATSGTVATVQTGSLFPESSWVSMIDPSESGANSLVYSTPFAAGVEQLEVEPTGRMHLAGRLIGNLLPGFRTTPGAFRSGCQADGNGPCGFYFYTVLDPSSDPAAALVYSSGLGVAMQVEDLEVDHNGRAYLAGVTSQWDVPSTIPGLGEDCSNNQPSCDRLSNSDLYVMSLDIERQGEEGFYFGGRIGGQRGENWARMAIDSENALYVVARTGSDDFPVTADAFDATCGGAGFGCPDEVVVLRLDPSMPGAAALRFASYLGGADRDIVNPESEIATGPPGVVYLSGVSQSGDFPHTPNASDTEWYGVSRGFVAAVDTHAAGASALLYTSFLGRGGESIGLTPAGGGRFLYTGSTTDPDFPTTPSALDRTCGFGQVSDRGTCSDNAFAMLIDPAGGPEASVNPASFDLSYDVPDPLPIEIAVTLTVSEGVRFDAFGQSEGDWLTTAPAELTGSGEVAVLASPGALSSGEYTGRVRFVSDEPVLRRGAWVKLRVGTPPPPTIGAVVHAADFRERPIAPGQIVSIFGTHLGPTTGAAAMLDINGRIPFELANVVVRVGDRSAVMIYARHDQINAIVPYEAELGRVANIQVFNPGGGSGGFGVSAAESAPGLFTANGLGVGAAAALNQDGSLNTAQNPAARGDIVVLYGTGEGELDPPAETHIPAGDSPGVPVLDVAVSIGGVPAEILYAGQAPGFSGLLQVNARVPAQSLVGDAVEVELRVGGAASTQGVTLAIR